MGEQSTASTEVAQRIAKNQGNNSVPQGGAGVGSTSSNETSVTKSGISGIAGDQSVRTGDTSSAGTLVKEWDTQAAIRDVQNQAQITQQFSQNAAREIGDYANRQRDAAAARGDKEEAARWAEGGEYRVALHSAAGLLSGGVGAALANGVTASAMPVIGEQIASLGLPAPLEQALGAVTAASIGGLVGGASGASTAYSTDINNRQLHPEEQEILKRLQKDKTKEEQDRLADAACALVGCANGMSPFEPGYADAVASQARGAQYTREQDLLLDADRTQFKYTATEWATDRVQAGAKSPLYLASGAKQTADNAIAAAKQDLENTLASLNPPQLPPDFPGSNGPDTGGPSAGAVVTPPVVACTPAGCVVAPPVGTATPGSSGYVPTNTTLNSGGGPDETGEFDSRDANLASPERTTHILTGDSTGGGHQWPGAPGKSPFPQTWSAPKIMDAVSDIATDPSIPEIVQSNGRIVKNGTRDGLNIRVVLEPPAKGGGIVTAFPTNVPKNPK